MPNNTTPTQKGAALLMVWANVPARHEPDFNRWYNEEHLAERLAVPGVLSAARYESNSPGAPKHLAMYELADIAVLSSPEYLAARQNPTDWTRRASPETVASLYIRNTYEQIFPAEVDAATAQSGMAPALQIGRMTVPPDLDAEWNDWYNAVYVPNYMKVPGCIRGRRYRAVEGEPAYLTVYEFEHPEVSQTPEWHRQRAIDPRNERWQNTMRHAQGSPGVWVKTFELAQ